MDPLIDIFFVRCGTVEYIAVVDGHWRQDCAIVRPVFIKEPALRRIDYNTL